MASRLAIALAEYTRGPRRGDTYRSEHHGDWIVHRIVSDEEIILRQGRGFITKTRAELAHGCRLKLRRIER